MKLTVLLALLGRLGLLGESRVQPRRGLGVVAAQKHDKEELSERASNRANV